MTRPKRQHALQRGHQGEAFVARVIESWGWTVLHRRWHCRQGEIDLVAQEQARPVASTANPQAERESVLAFIEVKVRSSGAWDDQGLSITWQKQQRIEQAARHFLMVHEPMAAMPCRFDVALVQCRPTQGGASARETYALQRYIKGAFDAG